jgi:hypothetical protein
MPGLGPLELTRELERGDVPPRIARHERLRWRRAQALAMVREQDLADARACWQVVPLSDEPSRNGWMRVGGRRVQAARLIPPSGRLTSLACAAATIGERLERRVRELFALRQASLALALDGVGNELLSVLSRRAQDRIAADARRDGQSVCGELRAGDPGLRLQAQRPVLELAGGAGLGIALTGTLMMVPAKSTTFVQGVGWQLPRQTWSRCDRCPSRARCTFAQAQAAVCAQGVAAP